MICRICAKLEPISVSRLSNMGVAKQSFSNFDKPRPHQTSVLLLRTDQNIMSP